MKSIIVGTTGLANQLYCYIKKYNITNVAAFAVNKDYIRSDSFLGLPVVELETLEQNYPPDEYNIYITIGYSQMNQTRQKTYELLKAKGYKFPNFIHPTVTADYDSIGEANIIFANTILECCGKIGNGNIFRVNSAIAHDSVIGDFNFFAIGSCICGSVQIGNNCFFGANCTIRNDIIVKDKTLIGAGSYLSRSSEIGQVIVPAKSLILDRSSAEIKI